MATKTIFINFEIEISDEISNGVAMEKAQDALSFFHIVSTEVGDVE